MAFKISLDTNKEEYKYDADGGVILKEKTNILSMPIDQTKEINKIENFI